MKQKVRNVDDVTAIFKLMIYDWNLNEAIKYYENDKFCHAYCIFKKHTAKCSAQHSSNTLWRLILEQRSRNFTKGEVYCLYLMNQKIHKNNNKHEFAVLFMFYGHLLAKKGKTHQDYLKSERYFLTSLNIRNNFAKTHQCYAKLLNHQLKRYDDAELHYRQGLQLEDPDAKANFNFAQFLFERRKKYADSLIYSTKACELRPNDSRGRCIKGLALNKLNRFDEAIDEIVLALKLYENDHHLTDHKVVQAKQCVKKSIVRYIERELKLTNYFQNEEGLELVKWLYDSQLLSIKREIMINNVSLLMLKQCTKNDTENLSREMKLTTATSIKFRTAVDELNTDSNNSNGNLVKQIELLKQENAELKQV